MAHLRIALLTTNAIGCIALGILSAAFASDDPPVSLIMIGMAIFLGVNAMYLYEANRPPRNNRLARMWRMWLDAKENELQHRATHPAGSEKI